MKITITGDQAGARVDKLLVQAVSGLGRAGAKRLFERGRVRIMAAGETYARRASKGDVASVGDVIEIDVEETQPPTAAAPDLSAPLSVTLERDDVLVLEKPAGQPTAPLDAGEQGTLANALIAR